ncbi:MAG: tetratricopeptide repeat protein [Candidatus Omnitrophica bacterium]|nr:tetratricopeptide repeat protein [Candidatus Omnitrophota bacterium]
MTFKPFQTARQSFRETFNTSRGLVLALALLTVVAHAAALNGSFKTMDDETSILNNANLRHFSSLGKIFTESFFGGSTYYRPLVTFSFLLEYQAFGLRPFFYYLTNVVLHFSNVLLVFLIFGAVLKKRPLAFAGALLFAVHPVHWEAVANIAGRSILLCALGQFLCVWFYLRHLLEEGRHRHYLLSVAGFVLALLSKEAAVTTPLLLAGVEFWLRRKAPAHRAKFSRREARDRLAPFAVVLAAYFALRASLGISSLALWPSLTYGVFGVLTFLRGVFTDLRIFVLPVDLHFDRATAYFTSFADGRVWATLYAAAVGIWALGHWRARLSRRAKFLMFWVAAGLFPVAQLVPLPAHPGYAAAADHFLYVPLVGLAGLTVLVGSYLFRGAARRKIFSRPAALVLVIGFYAYLTLITVGQDLHAIQELGMFEKSLSANPRNTRVRISYALALAKAGLFREAQTEFRKVLAAEPWDVRARIGLAKSLCDQGKCWEAVQEYESISDAGSMQDLLEQNLKFTYDAVIGQYRGRLALEPGNARLHYSLGIVYARTGRLRDAIQEYRAAARLDPRDRLVLYNLGALWEDQGSPEKAAVCFKKVVAFGRPSRAAGPGRPDELTEFAYRHLAGIYEKKDHPGRAAAYRRQLEKISGRDK